MKISQSLSNLAVAVELGNRLQQLRLNANLTTESMAGELGISRVTYEKLEKGHGKLITLIAALRTLNRLDALDHFLPPVPVSPIQLAKLHGKRRQRATGTLDTGMAAKKVKSTW